MALVACRALAAVLCLVPPGDGKVGEEDQLLKLDFDAFDQRPGAGWRLLAQKGRHLDAAKLIDRYREKHKELDESRQGILFFHAGQMYAFADDYKTALQRFPKSKHAQEPPELPIRWNAYVDATIAFLGKDLNRLKECREQIAKGPSFRGEKANLNVVDSLIENFGKPYRDAYGAHAKKPPAKKESPQRQ